MKNWKVAVLFVVLGTLYVLVRHDVENKSFAEYMKLYMQVHIDRIENTVNRSIESGLLLESMIRYLEPAFNEVTYNHVAGDIFDAETMISISYMPDGIVKWIYPPTEDNNNVLGLNVFEFEATKQGAYETKRSGHYMISGPLPLQSGEMGLTVRTPIFTIDNLFWGFVSIVYDSHKVAYEALEVKTLSDLGFKYAIHSSYNGERIPLLVSEGFDYEKAFYSDLRVADNVWGLFLYSDQHESERFVFLLVSIMEAIGICSVLLIIFNVIQKRQKQMQEQIFLDPLTKLFNRKKLDTLILNEKARKNKPFTVFYLDLNKFKPVNDTYGHLIGDKLLIAFAARLSHRFDSATTKIRVGGDEFVLIVESSLDDANLQRVKQRLITLAEEVFDIDDLEIYISTSVGFARYPDDASTITEVLEQADAMMYAEKQKKRSAR